MNLEFDFSPLASLLAVAWHTIGAPETRDRAGLGTKAFEREVVSFFAGLYCAKPDEIAGYAASGGTEANAWGCAQGRNRLPDAPLYFSDQAHFGVSRIARSLRMEPVCIRSLRDGRMDVSALHAECRRRRGRGAVVVATVGTTMLGAIDDISEISAAIQPAGSTHIHADAALGGLIAPFALTRVPFSFDVGADSIAVSCHKMIGIPMPCAMALARRDHIAAVSPVEYIGVGDSLLRCCRDGLAVLLVWYALRRLGYSGLAGRVQRCLRLSDYAVDRLEARGVHPWRGPCSTTVVFDRPREAVARRWSLAVEGSLAHLVVVPHVTRTSIDRLCRDLP
jgi:histidine decarboxylase